MAVTKKEQDGEHPASHYLVVEDPQSPSTWHLRVKDTSGNLDHRLMGAAWAALHGGYRGNTYEGPNKTQAIDKLKRMYAAEKMDPPSEKSIKSVMMCADLCQMCVQACMECIRMCSESTCSNKDVLNACIDACHHCVGECSMCAYVCNSGDLGEIGKFAAQCLAACQACIKACQACADSCPDCAQMCKQCADICQRCANECQSLLGTEEGGMGSSMSTMSMKIGARNSRTDMQRLQMIHDYSVENGAMCDTNGKSISPDDLLVSFENEIKVLEEKDGKVRVGGYLVRYGSPSDTDLTFEDFFDSKTDFGVEFPAKSLTWFNHRQPVKVNSKKKQIYIPDQFEPAVLTKDDIGVFFEGVLDERKEYDAMLIELARMGKLGLSSGTAPHLVRRSLMPNGTNHIDMWVLGLDASYTHRPAEYRNAVVPLKSLIPSAVDNPSDAESTSHSTKGDQKKIFIQESTMNEEERNALLAQVKTIFDESRSTLREEVRTVAKEAAQEVINSLPEVKTAMNIQVTQAAEDRPFKSIAENLIAIRANTVKGVQADNEYPRLRYLKATGASEGVPQDGGVLLDPTLTNEIIRPIHEAGPFSADARLLPVSGNSNFGWINGVNETSRVAGSRWGGIRGYRIAEGDTKTASKPGFRRINWELKEYAAVVVATDQLLADSSMFSEIVRTGVTEELMYMCNEDIFDGAGLAGCQGFMNSGALITVTRDTGSKILGADISAMYYRMDLRGRSTAKWYIGNDSGPQLDALFAVGSTAVLFPYASIGQDGVRRLYGRPVVTTEFNQTLNTTGDIVFADMNQYLRWEKGTIEEATSIHVYFLTDETAFRFVYRCDGKSAVNTALTPKNGSTTTSPFVALSSAT